MYKWIKNLVDAYDKMFVIETPKKPIIYKVGNLSEVEIKII